MPVTGGEPSADPAVVALVQGDTVACTGTVIAPRAVLTAGHCAGDAPWPEVVIDGARVAVAGAIVHPGFDPATLAHDVAILVLGAPAAVAPVEVAADLDGLAAGDLIRVVGFGAPDAGEQRSGTSRLDAIDGAAIVSSPAPAQTCDGDSGGPAFRDGGARLVAIASSGDTACAEFAVHVRADVHAGFIAGAVAASADGAAGAGERCWYDDNCAAGAGACTPALEQPGWSFCAPSCRDDDACPAELVCSDDACHHPGPSPGSPGAPCDGDAACATGLCVAPAGGGEPVCATRCFPDLAGFCADDASCRPAADGMHACFAAPAPPAGGCRVGLDVGPAAIVLIAWLLCRSAGRA